MNKLTFRILLRLSALVLLLASSGCSNGTGIDGRFRNLTKAVHAYCNTPAGERSPDARREILGQLDAFEAALAAAPEKTRNQYRDKVVNQRCFVAMAR